MVFTEDKAFIKILYVIIGYGLVPGKGQKRPGLDNLFKKWMSKGKHG